MNTAAEFTRFLRRYNGIKHFPLCALVAAFSGKKRGIVVRKFLYLFVNFVGFLRNYLKCCYSVPFVQRI